MLEKTEKDFLNSNSTLIDALKNQNDSNYQFSYDSNNIEEKLNPSYANNKYMLQENFEFLASKKSNEKPHKKMFIVKARSYIFPTNFRIFSCFQISIINPSKIEFFKNFIKSCLKTLLILFSLYFYIWIYLMVFIQSIYKQYGKNIVKICVMPLISMLVVKLLITFNFMILITSLILHNFGEYFLNSVKIPLIKSIIFNALVPPLALHHYAALNVFIKLMRNHNGNK